MSSFIGWEHTENDPCEHGQWNLVWYGKYMMTDAQVGSCMDFKIFEYKVYAMKYECCFV